MHSEIAVRVQRAIEERVFPGCVIGIRLPAQADANGSREVLPFGHLTYEANSPAVRENTVYDVASITKSIPTASLALMLMEEKKFALTDAVTKYLPELQNDYGATIEDLLLYRVQGIRLSTLGDKSVDEMLTIVFAHGFDAPSGESRYTNLPALLLGIVIERVTGESLDVLAQSYCFEPLNMHDTTFFPQTSETVAPTEIDSRGTVQGLPHDESARVFAKAGRTVGHAGLFSTVPDLLNFLESLLQGTYPHVTEGARKGLGWQVNDSRWMGAHAGPHTFGKTGFTGTSVLCDIERGIGVVILSNRTFPKRPADGTAIDSFRREIADIFFQ